MAEETTKAQTAKHWPVSVFSKIISGEVPTEFFHEDDKCIVIQARGHRAPVHLLVIPKKPIPGISTAEDGDAELLGHLLLVAKKMAFERGLKESGYRLVINDGPDACQSVYHLHVHIFGGRRMSWPPWSDY